MHCPKCGAEIDGKRWFCSVCGFPIHLEEDIIPREAAGTDEAEKGIEPGGETPRDPEESYGPWFRKSLWVRVLVTLLILGVLIGALLLVAYLKGGGSVAPVVRASFMTALPSAFGAAR